MHAVILLSFLSTVSALHLPHFIATVPYQTTPTVTAGQAVPFNYTIQNSNGAYDTAGNTFTCNLAGFYSLTFMMTKSQAPTQSDEFHLMSSLSGAILLKVVLPQLTTEFSSNSGTIVYHCEKGEYLWVQMCTFCGDDPLQIAWDLNMFSGVLLSPHINMEAFIATLPYQNGQSLNIEWINPGDTVPFSYTLQNRGGAFNNNTYMFTCQLEGDYIFSFMTTRNNYNAGSAEFHLRSTVNPDILLKVIQPELGVQFSSNGGTVMYYCAAGETLWVEYCNDCGDTAFPLSWDLNHFSGGLVTTERIRSPYSFIAAIPYPNVTTVTAGQTVPFTLAKQNIGAAYNTQNFTFTCPQTGLYTFSVLIARNDFDGLSREFHLMSSLSTQILLKVVLPQLSVQFSSNSGTVMYQCEQGERLWVQMCDYCGDNAAQLAWDLNTFSGQLMDR